MNHVKKLGKINDDLKQQVENCENHSLRFLRVPELAEGRDTMGFMNRFFPQLLGLENYPDVLVIEWVHRSPTFCQGNFDKGPQPILIKLLNFQDKVKILWFTREKKNLQYNGARFHIYPDFSADL
ncbi:hypothetical protein AAFF_G00439860 [Aldrovandia affinis]|uniref:Uncharacterized protein n=1 Tax=Aldrovandia affinis TaxID=143900 RepID=A0AAD7WHS0_9TELE|nr:hypothetical protein AAFF_G00439860 [Aldrovandia affinis]